MASRTLFSEAVVAAMYNILYALRCHRSAVIQIDTAVFSIAHSLVSILHLTKLLFLVKLCIAYTSVGCHSAVSIGSVASRL